MRTTRSAALCLLAPVVLGVSGCAQHENTDPGAKPGVAGIRDVVSVYAQALARGDGPRACSLMSADAQHRLVTRTSAGNCLVAVRTVGNRLSHEAAEALRSVEVSAAGAPADVADVRVSFPGAAATEAAAAVGGSALHLVRVDARWSIDTA